MPNPQRIRQLLEEALHEHCYSGYQLYLERGTQAVSLVGGKTSYWPQGTAVEESTVFDIGSVTKVVVTTSLLARALSGKKINFATRVGEICSEFIKSAYESIELGELLSHASGLAAKVSLPIPMTMAMLPEWFLRNEKKIVRAPRRQTAVYSDLGYLLLGIVLERVDGPLAESFANVFAGPLGMTEISYGPVSPVNCAATEYSLVRDRLLHGEVFDDDAFALGGVAPHAGLFSSARALAPWAREWLAAALEKTTASLLDSATVRKMIVPSLLTASTWGFGWDTKSTEGSTAGDLFSSRSFGHLGFPGCSVWFDPQREGFAVFLTNRVHPSRYDERIKLLRPQLHDSIAQLWDGGEGN